MNNNKVDGAMDFEVKFSKNRGKKCGIVSGTVKCLHTLVTIIWGRIFCRKVKVLPADDNVTQRNLRFELEPTPQLAPYYSEDDLIIDQLYQAIVENNPEFEISIEFQKLYDALPYIDPELDEQIEEILKAYAKQDSVENETTRLHYAVTD